MAKNTTKAPVQKVISILIRTYPDARCSLNYETPLQLLIATILSAQCTDARVNKITPRLFSSFQSAKDFAEAPLSKLESYIRSAGFYKTKAKYIKESCRIIENEYRGKVPSSLEGLLKLPGVGRKTANIVLGNAFGIIEGIPVDTHATRISNRLGWSSSRQQDKIEKELMQIIPRQYWLKISDLFIYHGRAICTARAPKCQICPINRFCPKYGVKWKEGEK
ncbi:MAG: endonuclease III [Candidatus Anstonellaceae archaeon]